MYLKELATNIFPDKEAFFKLAENDLFIPVVTEIQLDKNRSSIGIYSDLYYENEHSFLLHSGRGGEKNSRFSFLGGSPFLTFKYQDKTVTVNENGHTYCHQTDPVKSFSALLEKYKTSYFSYAPHFFGGAIGYFSYNLVHYLEQIPRTAKNDLNLPDIYFLFVDELVVIDHFEKKIKFICLAKTDKNGVDELYDNTIQRLAGRINQYHLFPCTEKSLTFQKTDKTEGTFQSNVSKKEFKEMVRKAKTYIREGEIYQANLSQRFQADFEGDPLNLFQYLQKINPSPFSAFLKFDDFYVVSSSPERLVKVYKDKIETRPIAGTRPRGNSVKGDKLLSEELLLNEKERAEHLMLVDLERNDLGRVCRYGSVEVNEFMGLEKYSHVFHIVSNISGILKKDAGLNELLRACFPGGTITGCPKIRSMEIINEIENIERGLYTGSLGYIGFSGEIDLNIIIRTILIKNKKAYIQAGAGIVADSDPEKEFYETENKARAMFMAIQNMSLLYSV